VFSTIFHTSFFLRTARRIFLLINWCLLWFHGPVWW
jgi:hypothetical protein